MANMTLPTILLMLPYGIAASIYRMEIFLKNIQDLTAKPTYILIPDIKAANDIFHQLLPIIPSETSPAKKIQQICMEDLMQSL